jgi:SAM-dependent MidA family methyltransferase
MTPLDDIIRAEIRAAGSIPFERFMELALYYPGLGYYAKFDEPSPIGRSGDFYTSVSVGPLFGRLLARQFFQMWQALGKPKPFWIVEQGAHDGQFACDVLEWCREAAPDFFAALRYAIIDASDPASIRQQCGPEAGLIPHMTWFENVEALAAEKPVGVFFSNELIDAFPVRAIVYRSGQWLECHVAVDEKDALIWQEKPIADAELRQAVEALDLPVIEGYITEINLRARSWMAGVAAALARGYVVTIDYGYPASIYYERYRVGGTLTAFVKHQASEEVLDEPGLRDITAHVDFTALARVGEAAGWATLGFLDQQRFLMGVAHNELSGVEGPRAGLAENIRAWNSLIHPDFLGSRFQVLIQAKNAPGELDGLRFARPGGL